MRRTQANSGETGAQSPFTALAPSDLFPDRRRQPEGQLLNRNGVMVCIPPQALGRRTLTWFSLRRWQRFLPRFPDRGVRLNADSVLQTQLGKIQAELSALSITCICQDHSHRDLLRHRLANLLHSNRWLGL